jgi:cation:H+ antiporter
MVTGALLVVGGIALVLWAAERFTDGAIRTAALFALSPFYVGAVVSGLEPENLATGLAAVLGDLPQVALGTVIGAAIFMLTAGLGVALLIVPMEVRIPRVAGAAMLVSLAAFGVALGNDGTVSRIEGALLVVVAAGLMAWLYRRSPVFLPSGDDDEPSSAASRFRALGRLVVGVAVMVVGAELIVRGVHALIQNLGLSETFLGMTVVALGESLEETARMVTPARRGHPELAWGNVVGTVVVLLGLNLGLIALARPVTADPLVLRLHAPYLAGCVLIVAVALLRSQRVGRGTGALLVALYILYIGLNLPHLLR